MKGREAGVSETAVMRGLDKAPHVASRDSQNSLHRSMRKRSPRRKRSPDG